MFGSSRLLSPPSWERRNAVLLTSLLALGYAAFATVSFCEAAPIRGRLALGASLLLLVLAVLAWRRITLQVLYPLILGLITALVWAVLMALALTHQPLPTGVLSSCGLVTGLSFTWYAPHVALRWTAAACLPVALIGLWQPFSDPPALVVGAMLLLLIMYITQYNHQLIRERHLRTELERQVSRDPLTGLYNRRVPLEQLGDLLGRAEPPHDAAVVLLDLDHFKRVNDTWGHTRGDDLLREVAGLLTQHLPTGSLLSRWGGEEFLVILYGQTPSSAQAAVHHVRQVVAQRPDLCGITLSAGGALLPEAASSRELIRLADERLYAAKAAGRNLACWTGTGHPPRHP
ncbi:GGDEF domain-containing protein [Deinococcus sedimenti]|uniref:GGDEF domain-containing protein n=1 Tax=Deinococcus sedimenti TaxID=1867090 RepID=A0ABQ2SC99_9DEIO|nr:GGDEF domain-containing protein [Deinococcus sedimenti]GGS07267.1 GGDEF domain-containing protein [Deinococcus sedimenti]